MLMHVLCGSYTLRPFQRIEMLPIPAGSALSTLVSADHVDLKYDVIIAAAELAALGSGAQGHTRQRQCAAGHCTEDVQTDGQPAQHTNIQSEQLCAQLHDACTPFAQSLSLMECVLLNFWPTCIHWNLVQQE